MEKFTLENLDSILCSALLSGLLIGVFYLVLSEWDDLVGPDNDKYMWVLLSLSLTLLVITYSAFLASFWA